MAFDVTLLPDQGAQQADCAATTTVGIERYRSGVGACGGTLMTVISIDLLDAAARSESFPREWNEEKRRRALARYEKFLRLAASHPGPPWRPARPDARHR
jgi:hypothetical protein